MSKIIVPILILLVACVAFISGCVGQTQTVSGEVNGLVIKNLYIDPPADQIQSGEPITVTADLENVGSTTARHVIAEVIGASWVMSGTIEQTESQTGDVVLVNYANLQDEIDGLPGATLTPPDPRYGLPGQIKTLQFRLPAPQLPSGQKANYELKIRVKYDYETSALAQISGYSRERYNSLFQMGKLTPPTTTAVPVQVSQDVPVTISLTGPDKLIMSGLYNEYTYQLTFKNVGSSLPITVDPYTGRETDGLIKGTVWLQSPGGTFFSDCLHVSPTALYNYYYQNAQGVSTGLNNFFATMQVQYADKFSAWYQNTPWGSAWSMSGRIGLDALGDLYIGVQQNIPTAPSIQWPSYILFPNALSWDVLGALMDPIKLRKGESVTKSCTIGIINDPTMPETWYNRPEDSIIFNAYLQYRYFIDEPITLTVTAPVVIPFPS